MYPKPVQNLIDLFEKFPGIGPRQAARFAFFVNKNRTLGEELKTSLSALENVANCSQCFRLMEKNSSQNFCLLCRDSKRQAEQIAVVEKEQDLLNLEKTGAYNGLYHILGGVVSPLDPDSPKLLHLKEMHSRVKSVLEKNKKCEVVLATSSTTEGDTTALYLERILSPLREQFPGLKISRLGRGLSLGSELEYADEITLKNALHNRK